MSAARQPSGRTLRRKMVEGLEANGTLTDPHVRKAFLAVPREHFLATTAATEGLGAVYVDRAVVTRKDERGAPTSSSSQPAIMAIMLERLELAAGHRVLEIGAGTGYNAALLATLVGEGGSVVSVELQPDLAAAAADALAAGGYGAQVVQGDGRHGWAPGAPYDRITLTASTGTVHRSWFDQLAPGGLLQLPLHLEGPDLQAVVTLRKENGGLRSTDVADGAFMVLRDAQLRSVDHQPSGLSVSEHVAGQHRSLGALAGDGLRRLSPAARRRLAEVMLRPPLRRSRLRGPAGGGSPALYLRLARPKGAVMLSYFRSGQTKGYGPVAAATTDGRSLAVLAPAERGGAMTLESYGDPRAGDVLTAVLDRWRSLGRPDSRHLLVEVAFGPDGEPTVRVAWAQPSTVSSRR